MNTLVLAEHFRAAFAADSIFAGRLCVNDQDATTVERPALVFACTGRSFSSKGTAFAFTLTVTVETSADWENQETTPSPAIAHVAAVEAVTKKLFGIPGVADAAAVGDAPTPRGTQLKAALNAEAIFDVRGWSCVDSEPSLETHHFRTPVVLRGTAIELV